MHLTPQVRQQKLAKLLVIEGLSDVEQLFHAGLFSNRPGAPSICMNEDCNYTCDMEPDQERGWCDECRTNSMMSGLILAELI
jgi:hypothetical protein